MSFFLHFEIYILTEKEREREERNKEQQSNFVCRFDVEGLTKERRYRDENRENIDEYLCFIVVSIYLRSNKTTQIHSSSHSLFFRKYE